MPPWSQLAGFLSLLVAIVAGVYKITRAIEHAQHQIDQRLQRLELRIASLESQTQAFLEVFPKIIAALVKGHVMSSDIGIILVTETLATTPIPNLLKDIEPTINPLSRADIDTIRAYLERLKAGQPLTVTEARDFYRITNIITDEYPAKKNSWLLFLISGLLLAIMITED